MNQNKGQVYLTKDGLDQLVEEVRQLKEKKLPDLIARVARARSFGDLSENTEYTAAREELAFIEGRIEELDEILVKAKVIQTQNGKKGKNKAVELGCKVTVGVNGQKRTYEVVGEWEADPVKKKISHSSPLGKALMGKRVGEEIEIEAPAGKIIYQIKEIL